MFGHFTTLCMKGLMYQKSAQKLLTDECYQKSVMEEFKNVSASLDDLMP